MQPLHALRQREPYRSYSRYDTNQDTKQGTTCGTGSRTKKQSNKPLTPEVMKQTALILVVAVSISILSFLLGKVIYNKYPQKKKSILQYCTLATIPVLMLFL